jgi:hypothetical protein
MPKMKGARLWHRGTRQADLFMVGSKAFNFDTGQDLTREAIRQWLFILVILGIHRLFRPTIAESAHFHNP